MLRSTTRQPFADRRQAGIALADRLQAYRNRPDVVVLALPRGGVPVAFEVAGALDAPLDVFVVRKLGMRGHPEFAIGAIASGGVRVLNDEAVRWYHIPPGEVDAVARDELVELQRRERHYREGRPPVDVDGKTVILIDDGLATGSSMRAAVQAVRARNPARVVVAVPVGARSTCDAFAGIADETVCAHAPEAMFAVGAWYIDFSQTSDEEVRGLLEEHARRRAQRRSSPRTGG